MVIKKFVKTGRMVGVVGVFMYISNSLSFKPRNDLSFPRETAECLCVEIDLPKDKNFVVCVVYRPPYLRCD